MSSLGGPFHFLLAEIVMSNKCSLCGKFRKQEDLVEVGGDSNDVGEYEIWIECKFCCAPVNQVLFS